MKDCSGALSLLTKCTLNWVHNQEKYLSGNAQNIDQPLPEKSVITNMINPSFSVPTFVVRLIPVLHLKGEFLDEYLN